MRTKLAAMLAVAVSFGAAESLAADMPAKAPPARVVAFTWTGFYAGVNVGGVWAREKRFADGGGVLNEFNSSAVTAGGQVGYNYQMGSLVLGAEASANWLGLDAGQSCPNPAFTCRIKHEYLLLAGGRVGWAFGKTLVYGTGGYARTNTRTSAQPFAAGFDSTLDQDGWYAGGGLEFAITPNLIGGFEYIYAEFNDGRYADPSGANAPYSHHPIMSLARVRLSYLFGSR